MSLLRHAVSCLCPLLLAAAILPAHAAQAGLAYHRDPASTSPYSPVVRLGEVLYVSGQLGLGADGKPLADFEAQVRKAMDNVSTQLRAAGSGLDQVGQCTALITDAANWAVFNRVYAGYFETSRLPARTAAVVAGLPLGAAVEVECIARAGAAGG